MPQTAPVYWYDEVVNFGDLIGPWLFEVLTGRTAVNVRGAGKAGLLSVGSLIQEIEAPGYVVCGSGLICPVSRAIKEKLVNVPPARICAVRGELTRDELMRNLGWDVPEVFGDPAFLLPRHYRPISNASIPEDRIGIVPHYIHKDLFSSVADDARFCVIDVQQRPQDVIDAISCCRVVVSTSLHGLICAHAYGIPWAWLRLRTREVVGADFKFEDAFTLFDRSQVVTLDVDSETASTDMLLTLAQTARLPESRLSLDALEASFIEASRLV